MIIKNPITNTHNTIFSKEGKITLKKYIEQFQLIGGARVGDRVDTDYPYTISDTGESHNEPIAPTRLNENTLFKGRSATTEMMLYKLFNDINNVLKRHKSIPQRLGIVNITPGVYRDINGSMWEYIEGVKLNEIEMNPQLEGNLYLLESVARLIGLTDLHSDNIIVKDNIPYCIDGEVFKVTIRENHETLLTTSHEFNEKLVDNMTYNVLRKRDIFLLIHNFRKDLNNFRVLLSSTRTLSDYSNSYGEYYIYVLNTQIGKEIIKKRLVGWSLDEGETMEDIVEDELKEMVNKAKSSYEKTYSRLKEDLISEMMSNNIIPNRGISMEQYIENITECIHNVAIHVYDTRGHFSYVPVFLCIDNNIYIQYTDGKCNKAPVARINPDIGIGGPYIHPNVLERLSIFTSGSPFSSSSSSSSSSKTKNKRKSNKRKSNKRKSNKRK